MQSDFVNPSLLDKAYTWLCKQRQHFPHNSDIWDLRFHWPKERLMILAELDEDRFYFQPQQQIIKANGDKVNLWSSRDSLVLKMLSL